MFVYFNILMTNILTMCNTVSFGVMPSSNMVSADGTDKLGPDYFTYYTRLVKDLLSQEDDFPSFSSNNVGSVPSDCKNERLNTLLQQAITILRPEVDEV